MIAALTAGGMAALMTILGGTSGDVFLAYVENVLLPLMKPGDILVLDNLAAHKIPAVADAIRRAGCFLKFLPPYSPDLMPIELSWSKTKQAMRRMKPRTHMELDAAFVASAATVTAVDAAAWFRHCGYEAQPS